MNASRPWLKRLKPERPGCLSAAGPKNWPSLVDALMLFCLALAAVAGLVALYWTATAWFHRWTTETDVTNMRVVHKTGFIKRDTFEMSLDKVESVDVKQSILGRLMNYGDLTIQGVGEGTRTISTITAPLAFRNAITTRPVGT